MKHKPLLIFLFGLFLAGSSFAQNKALHVEVYKLDNGLTIYLNEDPTATQVYGAVAVKAGSKYDPADATGLAHYLEHMCFKGTQELGAVNYQAEKPLLDSITLLYDKLAQTKKEDERNAIQKQINAISVRAAKYAVPNEMDRLLRSIGGDNVNAFTSNEMVVYLNTFPAYQLEKWLEIYSHRFVNPVFRLFQSELEVVYEEKNMGSESFFNKLAEKLTGSVFKHHPYGTQTTIGKTEHLKNPPLRKMMEYYNTYFVANNMALIITGNFSAEQAKPWIREKFGKWRTGTVPAYPKYEEKAFKGRETVKVRYSPIRLGALAYRTVPIGHPDEPALEVLYKLLNNDQESGMLDQLRTNGRMMGAFIFPLSFQDHGALAIGYVPKLIGQRLSKARRLVRGVLDDAANGKFEDKQLEAARNNLLLDFSRNLESNADRGLLMVNAFIYGQSWEEVLAYQQKLKNVKREEVMAVAKKYFGNDYLDLQSRMGFPKKDKLKKPGFEPVKPEKEQKSEYAQKFEQMNEGVPAKPFVDFQKDLASFTVPAGKVFVTPNPLNDIFTLKLLFRVNDYQLPGLDEAAQYVSMLGGGHMENKDFRRKLSEWGLSLEATAPEGRNLVVTLSGLEQNLDSGLALLRDWFYQTQPDAAQWDLFLSDLKMARKTEMEDPQTAANVLFQYTEYGENSPYLRRASRKQLQNADIDSIVSIFQSALRYPVSIHFVGKTSVDGIKGKLEWLTSNSTAAAATAGNVAEQKFAPRKSYTENTYYILNRKNARQSHIFLYSPIGEFKESEKAASYAFSEYFGGDMSSLAFQEIRELRSLAYAVSINVGYFPLYGYQNALIGYLGCQGDKTGEALKAVTELITNMPEKPERMDALRKGLIANIYTRRPGFRLLSVVVETWMKMGYTSDPNAAQLEAYKNLSFEDIVKYYKEHVQKQPVAFAIVGNVKNIPIEELKKTGKVIIVEDNDIMR